MLAVHALIRVLAAVNGMAFRNSEAPRSARGFPPEVGKSRADPRSGPTPFGISPDSGLIFVSDQSPFGANSRSGTLVLASASQLAERSTWYDTSVASSPLLRVVWQPFAAETSGIAGGADGSSGHLRQRCVAHGRQHLHSACLECRWSPNHAKQSRTLAQKPVTNHSNGSDGRAFFRDIHVTRLPERGQMPRMIARFVQNTSAPGNRGGDHRLIRLETGRWRV